ncbi:MAG: ABC transporter permease [Flavobacteriaceae bacterium]|nr:ABC transporter permease [Flavobacteriaceae bacterium]
MNYISEAFISILQSKTRSILAGFGIAWGIFILVLLLGTGKGFQQGIMQLFHSFAKNSLWIYGGQVSESNLNKSTQQKLILFDNTDIAITKERFSEIEFISPELTYKGNTQTSHLQNTIYPQIKGVLSDYFNVKIIKPEKGRLLNVLDNKEHRRVTLIGKQIADVLFPMETALGKLINIAGTYFTVIGIIEKGTLFSQNNQNLIYVPYNTFLDCFNLIGEFNTFVLALKDKTDTSLFENKIKSFLSKRKGFDKEDKKALFILNFESQVKAFEKLFKGVDAFLWFVGLSLLLSGMVGISNIMLVIVKEKTFEIGIRKALGASPKSITWMIMTESIIITSIAGIIGLLLGSIFISLINWIIISFFNSEDSLFKSAGIDFPILIFSLFILILTGVLAGFFPAQKAANISPVAAIGLEGR